MKIKEDPIVYIGIGAVWIAFGIADMQENTKLGIIILLCGVILIATSLIRLTKLKKAKNTLDYYENNADTFADNTFNADMSETRDKFTALLPAGGTVLDWGCGSGRDTLAFKICGFQVEATDASSKLCEIATEKTGIDVRCEKFSELKAEAKYDGIWACASLLHEQSSMLPEDLILANKALKDGGVLYMSFKYGTSEGMRNDRYFVDMTEDKLSRLVNHIKYYTILETWVTSDVRPGRSDEKWLNVLVKKEMDR